MDMIAQNASGIASGVSAVGTLLSANGQVDAGNAGQDASNAQASSNLDAQRLANYQAAQLQQNAGQTIAQGTQLAQNEQRKSDLTASRAIAVAAASGGGALDPTVVRILQGISATGQLNTDTQMYNANEQARGMTDKAGALIYQGQQDATAAGVNRAAGKNAAAAGRNKALSTVLSGAGNALNTWGNTPAPNSGVPDLTSSTDYSYNPNGS